MGCDGMGTATHRTSWDLTDIAKSYVFPAVVNAVSATIGTKVVRSDKDGLGDRRLAPRIWPTWRCGGAQREIQGQEFDTISRLDTDTHIPPPKKHNVNQ